MFFLSIQRTNHYFIFTLLSEYVKGGVLYCLAQIHVLQCVVMCDTFPLVHRDICCLFSIARAYCSNYYIRPLCVCCLALEYYGHLS